MTEFEREYYRLRQLGWNAKTAFRSAKIDREFFTLDAGIGNSDKDDLDPDGLVRFCVVPDESYGMDIEEEKEIERANRDGVWGLVGEYRLDPSREWEHADSVWGFIGEDWKDSGYEADIKAETLGALKEAQNEHSEETRAYLIVRALRDHAGTAPADWGPVEQTLCLSQVELDALSRVLHCVEVVWKLEGIGVTGDFDVKECNRV